MSHIDEGLLHAHLDGAIPADQRAEWAEAERHLAVCPDCRRLLAEARKLRQAAGDLLAGAVATTAPRPPFEALEDAAGLHGARQRPILHHARWWRSTAKLAWAASLVLAAGAGWLGRELVIQSGRQMPAVSIAEQQVAEPEEGGGFADDISADSEAEAPARRLGEADERVGGRDRVADNRAEPPAERAAQTLEGESLDKVEESREGELFRGDDAQARRAQDAPRAAALEAAVDRDVGRDSLLAVAREIMGRAGFAALITLDDEGRPRARTMDPFPPEPDLSVWLATNPRSRKVDQITADDRVTLYYFDGQGYVTLMGIARVVDAPEEKQRRWKPGWEAFYPDRDSSYLLIEVRPRRLEIVSPEHDLNGDPVTWTPDGVELGPR